MKWLTPVLPYLAVAIGLFWLQNAFCALLGFHLAIILSLLVARSTVPINVLFKSKDLRCVILSILCCGSSGISLYFFWSYFGIISDLATRLEAYGLTRLTWPLFITYFASANPLIEEYFWRGYLGSSTKGLYISDFLYAGFHAFILVSKMATGSIIYGLILLTLAGWFWRQIAHADGGLLAPVLGHMAADFTILMAVFLKVSK